MSQGTLLPTGSSARMSDCGQYRYSLSRTWGDAPLVMVVGLNPSTADGETDDHTIRKCIGFARRLGYGGLLLGNLYALRSTDKTALDGPVDPVGPENDVSLLQLAARAQRVIVAWGAWPGPLADRPRRMTRILRDAGHRQVYALRVCADGSPAHPARLPYDLYPVLWAPRDAVR